MVEKSCSRSHGHPEPGVRSAAMISSRRSIPREGVMPESLEGTKKARGLLDRAPWLCSVDLSASGRRDRDRLAALRRVDHAHVDRLTLGQMGDAGRAQNRNMDEHVLAAVIARHEAEALGVVEPFDLAGDADRR